MELRSVCLDTNAYSALLRDEDLRKRIESSRQIYVPIIVVAELLFGFKKGKLTEKNLGFFTRFLEIPEVSILQTSWETAEIFSSLKLDLMKVGRPIPTNDLWIAALTIEVGSNLISRDKHFQKIKGLRVYDF